jgi:hypothetical protein
LVPEELVRLAWATQVRVRFLERQQPLVVVAVAPTQMLQLQFQMVLVVVADLTEVPEELLAVQELLIAVVLAVTEVAPMQLQVVVVVQLQVVPLEHQLAVVQVAPEVHLPLPDHLLHTLAVVEVELTETPQLKLMDLQAQVVQVAAALVEVNLHHLMDRTALQIPAAVVVVLAMVHQVVLVALE